MDKKERTDDSYKEMHYDWISRTSKWRMTNIFEDIKIFYVNSQMA